MDRKRSYLGLGSEIAESKTIEYPLIFTPPPTKLTKFIVDQFLLDGGFHFKFPVPGCNFTVEIDEYCTPHQIIFFLDLVFEDAFTLINVADPRTAGEFDVAEESYEVPEGIDTSQYKCAFVKFLSEFQEEDTHSYIFRLLRGSFRVDEARKPMSVTLRMKGRSKEGKKEKLGILLPFTNDPLGILLPFNDLLNACPISTNSPVRFSHGPHLSPEFRHGHIELHLHLFMLDHSNSLSYSLRHSQPLTRFCWLPLQAALLYEHSRFSERALYRCRDFKSLSQNAPPSSPFLPPSSYPPSAV